MIRSFIKARRLRALSSTDFAKHMRGSLHSVGENCAISPHATITDPHLLSIGNNVRLARCTIFGHDGSVNMINRMLGAALDNVGPVIIENNVFVGEGVIILPGTTIESNTIIGAGSVVRGRVKGGHVYAGNPLEVVSTIEDHVAKVSARTAAYPWKHYLAGRRGPAVEAKLSAMRVALFFGKHA